MPSITDTTISVGPNQPPIIIAPGDLSPTTTITIWISSNTTSAPLAVNGMLGVDGVLTIILGDAPAPGTYVVPIIDSAGISGNFSRIEVNASSCILVTSTSDIVGGSTLVALLEVSEGNCGKSGRKLAAGAIAGISIGAVAGGALIVLAILLIVKKVKPGGALFNSYETDSYVI